MDYKEALEELKYCVEKNQGFTECRYASQEAYLLAIETLEKQIPKKPGLYEDVFDTGEGWVYICPTCGEYIAEDEHHCKCGQRIDWSEVS